MKRYVISIFLSLISILGIIFQNYRLAVMYNESGGKNRALFGITEIAQYDIKLYLGIFLFVALLIGIIAIRRKENKIFSLLSIIVSLIGIILLFFRIWTIMI